MHRQLLSVVVLVAMALSCAGEAGALVQRTFVSGLGSDTNPCTRTEPCRTFAAAIALTLPGGEVLALDTAGYGPVSINKEISLISAPGVYAGITTTVGATNAITIDAGATDVVVLKGLSLNGLKTGNHGIAFNTGGALHVEGLSISGFEGDGIFFHPGTDARLAVTDTVIRNNSIGTEAVAQLGSTARVAIERTRFVANGHGLIVNNLQASVRDTVSAANAGFGFVVTDGTAVLLLENGISTDNGTGISSVGVVRVAGTTVTQNSTGLVVGLAGSILSRGNNTVEGNTSDGAFTGSFSPK